MADFGQEIGEWIAACLADTGMKASWLARESGVARSTIDALINGTRPADPDTYRKLADVLSPGTVKPLRQVVGGPRILADATTPRQALSIARRAVDKAEKLLGPIRTQEATSGDGPTDAEKRLLDRADEMRREDDDDQDDVPPKAG
jgi:hypothetical protein